MPLRCQESGAKLHRCPRDQPRPLSSLQPGHRDKAMAPCRVAPVPTAVPGDQQPSFPWLQPCVEQMCRGSCWLHSCTTGDSSRAPWAGSGCFCFQMRNLSPAEGVCPCQCCNDRRGTSPRGPHGHSAGQAICLGALLPRWYISCEPRECQQRGHVYPAGCFSPFEGCVAQRRFLAGLCWIVLFRKIQITPQ